MSTHLANGFGQNLFKLLRAEWAALIESDELVQRVKAGLLNEVVTHTSVLHLVVNAAVTDGVDTTTGEGVGSAIAIAGRKATH